MPIIKLHNCNNFTIWRKLELNQNKFPVISLLNGKALVLLTKTINFNLILSTN